MAPNISKIEKQGLMTLREASREIPIHYYTLLRWVKTGKTPPIIPTKSGVILVNKEWVEKINFQLTSEPQQVRHLSPKPYMSKIVNPITEQLLLETMGSLLELEAALDRASALENTEGIDKPTWVLKNKLNVFIHSISDYTISGIETSEAATTFRLSTMDKVLWALLGTPKKEDIKTAKELISYYTNLINQILEIEGISSEE